MYLFVFVIIFWLVGKIRDWGFGIRDSGLDFSNPESRIPNPPNPESPKKLIRPSQVQSSPSEASAEGSEHQFVTFFELFFIIPEAKWNGGGGGIAVF
jgi:hypothetical protein